MSAATQTTFITGRLNAFEATLSGLRRPSLRWEIMHALHVAQKMREGPLTRQSLLAVMEASLGISDRHLLALQHDTEEWLALEAPHELEHYWTFRVCTQFAELPLNYPWHCLLEGHDWEVLTDDEVPRLAVSTEKKVIKTAVAGHGYCRPGHQLLIEREAYSELGFGQAVLTEFTASPIDLSRHVQALRCKALGQLPRVNEYMRQFVSGEHQLALWDTAPGETNQNVLISYS